jgi:hypothetical protein
MFAITIKLMKKIIASLSLLLMFAMPTYSYAWGKSGHEIVAQIAFNYLDEATKKEVMRYLKRMSIEQASTWMDENRSEPFYNYMRPWHYIDITKGEEYVPTAEKNMITVLKSAIYGLQHKETLSNKQISEYIKIIFHLVGDLHQPLHTGYPEDKGGNTIEIKSPIYNGNLHSFWDTQIIEAEGIKLKDCLDMYSLFSEAELKSINKINVLQWMKQSRSLLDQVYDFKDGKIERPYIDSNKIVIKRQLLIGGLRLASVLRDAFKPAVQPDARNNSKAIGSPLNNKKKEPAPINTNHGNNEICFLRNNSRLYDLS